jgi:hypothetical protein
MNTQKSIYEKLFKNEQATELASHKVDLALSDDAKSVLKEAAAQAVKHKKLLATIRKNGDAINASLKASGVLNNKQLGKLIVQRGQKLQQQFLKMEKELGVSLKGSELDKQISEIVMNGEDIQGSIDDTFSALTQIGK